MKLKNIIYAVCVLLPMMFFSCQEDIEAIKTDDRVKVEFKTGIQTRVDDAQWDIGDAIGIAMLYRTSEEIVDNKFNSRYTTSSTTGDFTPGTLQDVMYFPPNNEEVTFKSYYPYNSAIQSDLIIPISVANQDFLPAIDFMSADHLAGFSKADPNVLLDFHHRLSKVIFRLNTGDGVPNLSLEDVTLTVKGMNTTGSFQLLNDTLLIDDTSTADIVIPRQSAASERMGIVLPREAGTGVSFEFTTPDGSTFIAEMGNDLELESGYKYIFNVLIEGTEVSVSVTIEDWIEGPTTFYDVLGVTTPAGESTGVVAGDQMQVYIRQGEAFQELRVFTYGADGRWTTPNPVFWENILQDPVDLRASLIPRQPAANDTQLPDIILAEELSVARNTGADFIFNHAGSRVSVELRSNVFTADQLAAATITLPGYLVGGTENLGVFVPGTTRGNILVDRTDPADQFAIIQPQSVSPGGAMVRVTVDGRDFTAQATDEGFLYEAGVAYQLIIMVNESDISVSARVVDWVGSGPHEFDILEVAPTLEDTEGVEIGATMNVYLRDTTNITNNYNDFATFTYTGNNNWQPYQEVYWQNITTDYVDLRASIIAQPKLNEAQIDDILIANDLRVDWGTGVDFVFNHAGSRAVVALVSDTFDETALNSATIVMPQYTTGATEQAGQFVPGQSAQDITLVRDASTNNGIAIIQPQTIAAGQNLFRVRIGTRDYFAKAPEGGFTYAPGTSYAITIHMNENNVTVSAQVIPWTQQEVDLNAVTIGVTQPGASSGINNGEQMNVYISDGTDRNLLSTFTYNQGGDTWTASPVVYWESITGNPSFYGSILRTPRLDPTQLDDYLIADPLSVAEGEPLNFTLRHPASMVTVQLRSSDNTFSQNELANMVITLPNYVIGGEHNNGLFTFPADNPTGTINVPVINNTAMAIIRPQVVINRPVVNINDPATGINYPVTSNTNITFLAGEATILNIDMRKTAIGISANAIDWQQGATIPLTAPSINITGTVGPTSTFFQDRNIYAYKLGSDFRELVYHYEPVGGGDYEWRGTQTLYWDDLNGQPLNITGVYYPEQATVPSLSQANTTFAWNLPTNQSGGYDQYDILMSPLSLATPSPVNFNFTHILSRVRVRIVTNAFTEEELEGMSITLNNFIVQGSASITTGLATGTNTRSTITPYTHVASEEYSALVMPQTIAANTPVVTVTLREYQNVPFVGTLQSSLTFVPGRENVITVTLLKTAIQISATLEDWQPGTTGSVTIQ